MIQVLKRKCSVSCEATLAIDAASFLSFHVGVSVFYTTRKAQENEREEHVSSLPLFGDHFAERDMVLASVSTNKLPELFSLILAFDSVLPQTAQRTALPQGCPQCVSDLFSWRPAPHLTQVFPSTSGSARDRADV